MQAGSEMRYVGPPRTFDDGEAVEFGQTVRVLGAPQGSPATVVVAGDTVRRLDAYLALLRPVGSEDGRIGPFYAPGDPIVYVGQPLLLPPPPRGPRPGEEPARRATAGTALPRGATGRVWAMDPTDTSEAGRLLCTLDAVPGASVAVPAEAIRPAAGASGARARAAQLVRQGLESLREGVARRETLEGELAALGERLRH